jgi:hypothetical protein
MEKFKEPMEQTEYEHRRQVLMELAAQRNAEAELAKTLKEAMKTPEQQRADHDYMFGPSTHNTRKPQKTSKVVKRRKANKVASKQRKKK